MTGHVKTAFRKFKAVKLTSAEAIALTKIAHEEALASEELPAKALCRVYQPNDVLGPKALQAFVPAFKKRVIDAGSKDDLAVALRTVMLRATETPKAW